MWARVKRSLAVSATGPAVGRDRCLFSVSDCRSALKHIPSESIDCTITSPPYGALKDYGSNAQLGFGQESIEEYLTDLGRVLGQLFRVSRPGGALWLVLDTLKVSGKTVLLPWEVATRAMAAGWALHEIIIWDKGRTLPWSHRGRFRGAFEHILLLGKGTLKHFNLNAVREIEALSPYWVRYPERFHPFGKAPTDLWHFPIPVQGSWSNNGVRHFCPFPLQLVARMLAVTTARNAIVLDPFAGTGSVLAVAARMKRYGLGIEVSRTYGERFAEVGYSQLRAAAEAEIAATTARGSTPQDRSAIIVGLRAMKVPVSLVSALRQTPVWARASAALKGIVIAATLPPRSGRGDHPWGSVDITLVVDNQRASRALLAAARSAVGVPPLSKFGLGITVVCRGSSAVLRFLKAQKGTAWYVYRRGRFHEYSALLSTTYANGLFSRARNKAIAKVPPIVSNLALNVALPIGS